MSQRFPEFADGSEKRQGPIYFFGEMVRFLAKHAKDTDGDIDQVNRSASRKCTMTTLSCAVFERQRTS